MTFNPVRERAPSAAQRVVEQFLGAFKAMSRAAEDLLNRLLESLRESVFGQLKPFPITYAVRGLPAATLVGAAAEPVSRRELYSAANVAATDVEVLRHAHVFMTSLPTWIPMPQTRRQGRGQIVLEWEGDRARHFSVMIGSDGMLIYSARLAAHGRFDGAEPVQAKVSPIVLHALARLHD